MDFTTIKLLLTLAIVIKAIKQKSESIHLNASGISFKKYVTYLYDKEPNLLEIGHGIAHGID